MLKTIDVCPCYKILGKRQERIVRPGYEGLNGVVAFTVIGLKFWLFYGYRLIFFSYG